VNILHTINIVDPRSGGPSNVIRNLVREQVALGHQVSVLTTTTQTSEPWAPREEYTARMMADPDFADVELVMARSYGQRRPFSRWAYSPAGDQWLRRVMNDESRRPHVVHIHGVFSHVTTRAAAWARKFQVPYLVRPAGSLDAACFEMGYQRLKYLFSKVYLQRDLDEATAIHVTSDAEAEELGHWVPPERIVNIAHGARVPEFDRDQARAKFIKEYPQLEGRRVVLYMSRITEKKRLEHLVEAVAQVRKDMPELCLLVAGHDAGHLPVVKQAIDRTDMQDHCIFTDFLDGERKIGAFAAADLFALLSVDENFGVAIIEAMAHGVPVLLTEGVASHVYVDAAEAGRTIGVDLQQAPSALEDLLAEDLASMGARGRQYIQEHLSWESIARQLDEVYERFQSSLQTA